MGTENVTVNAEFEFYHTILAFNNYTSYSGVYLKDTDAQVGDGAFVGDNLTIAIYFDNPTSINSLKLLVNSLSYTLDASDDSHIYKVTFVIPDKNVVLGLASNLSNASETGYSVTFDDIPVLIIKS
jgi:hypothetical protein